MTPIIEADFVFERVVTISNARGREQKRATEGEQALMDSRFQIEDGFKERREVATVESEIAAMTEAAATAPPRRHTLSFGRGCIALGVFNALLAYVCIARCGGADYSFTADRRIRLEDLANPSYPCIVVGFNSVVRAFQSGRVAAAARRGVSHRGSDQESKECQPHRGRLRRGRRPVARPPPRAAGGDPRGGGAEPNRPVHLAAADHQEPRAARQGQLLRPQADDHGP